MYWEYKVITMEESLTSDLQKELNNHGNNEWELISIEITLSTITKKYYRVIFKRPRKN